MTGALNEKQREEFARDLECNFAISLPGVSRSASRKVMVRTPTA